MPVPDIMKRLIETFDRNIDTYRCGAYNETQLRREFTDPLFNALGWDVANTAGYAEAYKDVIHEDAIKIGADHAAPDYCFRIGGTRKFFVETKKPAIDIKQDIHPAFQLRRYAWSAKLPLSIVTDFEEFAVYDCRVKPVKTDPASKARTLYIKYDQYADRWDEIANIFSRDAILKGSFDKYVATRKKRGTAEVDDAFLAEIEKWRDALARNLALRNPNLTSRQLNYAVQVTIDRLIFLRICEDRGIEPYQQLRGQTNGANIYQRLFTLFQHADDRYNSGLFHFHPEKERTEAPDELTPSLNIDDKILRDILRSLYYPDCPYEFSVLPADILGHVYEQFLGQVITLSAGHRAKIETKPEVKKAGGVYYTPTYIVDYIVAHTVGKLLADRRVEITHLSRGRGKKRHQVPLMDQPLRILDPACGSGSFLIVAYQKMLDWYLNYYTNNDPQSWSRLDTPPIFQTPTNPDRQGAGPTNPDHEGAGPTNPDHEGAGPTNPDRQGAGNPTNPDRQGAGLTSSDSTPTAWQLTTAERKRILLDHLFGVDIDTQAVEVTKLSLLLKVLENETQAALDNQLRLFHERALPDLSENIKCGNSLIGPDFYAHHQGQLFDEDQHYRLNAFDWPTEFPHIFQTPNALGHLHHP